MTSFRRHNLVRNSMASLLVLVIVGTGMWLTSQLQGGHPGSSPGYAGGTAQLGLPQPSAVSPSVTQPSPAKHTTIDAAPSATPQPVLEMRLRPKVTTPAASPATRSEPAPQPAAASSTPPPVPSAPSTSPPAPAPSRSTARCTVTVSALGIPVCVALPLP